MLIEVVAYSSATRFSLHSQLLVGSLPKGKGSRFPYGNRLPDKHAFLRGASVGQTHSPQGFQADRVTLCGITRGKRCGCKLSTPSAGNKEVQRAFRQKHFKHYRPHRRPRLSQAEDPGVGRP